MALTMANIVQVDLADSRIFRSPSLVTIGEGDILADRFGVELYRNNVPVSLSGVSCQGFFIRPTGETVVIVGEKDGNTAYVDLPQACYVAEGQFALAIKLIGSGVTGTMRIVDGIVSRTTTDTLIDPGEVVPDIAELLAKIEACENATTAAQAAVSVVDDFKNKMFTGSNNLQFTAEDFSTGYYNATTGASAASNLYMKSAKFTLNEVDYLVVTAPTGRYCALYEWDENSTYLGRTGVAAETEMVQHSIIPGHSYAVAIGKFENSDGNRSSDYLTDEFIASIGFESKIRQYASLDEDLYVKSAHTLTADGWTTGYYDATTGATTSSNRYIRSPKMLFENGGIIDIVAPTGHFVAVYEWANNVYVGRTGNAQTERYIRRYINSNNQYAIVIGRFNNDASSYLTDAFIGQMGLTVYDRKYALIGENGNKLPYQSGKIFFTVSVPNPVAFGGEEELSTPQNVEAVLMLPTSYTPSGNKTRLVLCCHGASGYIRSSTDTWSNSAWLTFMNQLLAAGYAVFDANVVESADTDLMGYALGSPIYTAVLKKAYNWIVRNYNVYEQILVHGTSMGGIGASGFVKMYPQLVLAQSSFAGRDVLRYLDDYVLNGFTNDMDRAYSAYGYADNAAMLADKFSHMVDNQFTFSLTKYVNGARQEIPDRETDFDNWLAYFDGVYNLTRGEDSDVFVGYRTVPYKAWNSWEDRPLSTHLEETLQRAYARGSNCPYYIVNYETGTHTELCYGQINDMIPQLLAWFKRWE